MSSWQFEEVDDGQFQFKNSEDAASSRYRMSTARGERTSKLAGSMRVVQRPGQIEQINKSSNDFLQTLAPRGRQQTLWQSTMGADRNQSQQSFQSTDPRKLIHKDSNTLSAVGQNSSVSQTPMFKALKNSQPNMQLPFGRKFGDEVLRKQSMLSDIPVDSERRGSSLDQSNNQLSLLDSERREIAPMVYLLPMQHEKQTAEASNASYHTFSNPKKQHQSEADSSVRPQTKLFFKKAQQKETRLSRNRGSPELQKELAAKSGQIGAEGAEVSLKTETIQYIRALQREIETLRKVVEHLTNSIAARDNLIRDLNSRITKPVSDAKHSRQKDTQAGSGVQVRARGRSLPVSMTAGHKNSDFQIKTREYSTQEQEWADFVESALLLEPPQASKISESEDKESRELASHAHMSKHKTFLKGRTTDSNAFGIDGDSQQLPIPQPENTTKSKQSASIPLKSTKPADPAPKSLKIQELIDYVAQNPAIVAMQTSSIVDLKEYRIEKDLLHQFLSHLREGGSLNTQEFRSLFVSHLPQMRRLLLHITEGYEKQVFGNLRMQSITQHVLEAAAKGFGQFSQDLRQMLRTEMACEDARLFLLVPGDPRFYYWSEIDQRFESFLPKVSIDQLKSKPWKTRQMNFENEDFDSQIINKETEIEKIFGYRLKNQLTAKILLKQSSKVDQNRVANLYHQQVVGFVYCMNKHRDFTEEGGASGRLQRKLHSNYSQLEIDAQEKVKDGHTSFQFTTNTTNLQPLGDPNQVKPKQSETKTLQSGKHERLTQDFSVDDVALVNLLSGNIGGLVQATIFSMQFEDHIREESELLKLFPSLLQQNSMKSILLEGQRLLQNVFNSKRARVALLHDSDMWFLVESLQIRQAKKAKWVTAPEPSSDSMAEQSGSLDEDEIIERMIKKKARPYSPSKFALNSGSGATPKGVSNFDKKNTPTMRFMKVQMSERELIDVNHYQLAQVITNQAGVLGWVARHPAPYLSDCLNEENNFEAESDIDTCLPALTLPIFDPRRKDRAVFGVIQVELMNLGIKLLRGERKDTLAQAYTATAFKICNVLGIFIASKFDSFPEFCKEDPVTQLDLETFRHEPDSSTPPLKPVDTTI